MLQLDVALEEAETQRKRMKTDFKKSNHFFFIKQNDKQCCTPGPAPVLVVID
jgi:hypothetical protein